MSKENVTRLCGAILHHLALKENVVLEDRRTGEPSPRLAAIRIYGMKDLAYLPDCLEEAMAEEPIRRKLRSKHENPVKSIVTPYIQLVTCAYKQKTLPRENLADEMRRNVLSMQRCVVHHRLSKMACGYRNDNAAGIHVLNGLLDLSETPVVNSVGQRTAVLLDQLKTSRDQMVSKVDCVQTYAWAKWQRHGLPIEVLEETPLERDLAAAYRSLDAWEPF